MQTLVSTKYQVVIPKEIRKRIQVKPGQRMDVEVVGEKVILSPARSKRKLSWPKDYVERLRNPWEGVDIEKYIDDERNSWD